VVYGTLDPSRALQNVAQPSARKRTGESFPGCLSTACSFFETARLHAETWSIRRDFYLKACLELLSLWRDFDQRGGDWYLQTSGTVSIQSLPVDASGHLLVEDPVQVGLWAMVSLFGMAQVEVAEILGWTESSVQRALSEYQPTWSP